VTQQTKTLERYSNAYQQFLRGDLADVDLTKWGQFWLDESNRMARGVTEANVTYFEALMALGADFAAHFEQAAATKSANV
jgi:hypothetical protein